MSDPIKPAPCISFPASGVPETRVRVNAADEETFRREPRVVVIRGAMQAKKIRIIRRNWT